MTLQSFSLSGITYRQQLVKCGKNCGKCPNHGPYWFAAYWSRGKVVTRYIGKHLPEGIQAPPPPPLAAPARKVMGRIEAYRLLGIKLSDGWTVAQKKWIAARKQAQKATPYDPMRVVQMDEAWSIIEQSMP